MEPPRGEREASSFEAQLFKLFLSHLKSLTNSKQILKSYNMPTPYMKTDIVQKLDKRAFHLMEAEVCFSLVQLDYHSVDFGMSPSCILVTTDFHLSVM